MVISGDKISLRFAHESDVRKIIFWENEDENGYTNLYHDKLLIADVLNWVKSRKNNLSDELELRFIICEKGREEGIGAIDLFEFDKKEKAVGIGLIVEKEFRKRGVATEALQMLVQYCLVNFDIKTFWCYVHKQNAPSLSLFLKCGFKISDKISHHDLKREMLFLQLNYTKIV